jgi:hypothetical protein
MFAVTLFIVSLAVVENFYKITAALSPPSLPPPSLKLRNISSEELGRVQIFFLNF